MTGWTLVAPVAVLCFALRAAMPLLLRAGQLPPALARRLDAAVVPVLAALAALQLFTSGGRLIADDRTAGAAVAAVAFAWRRNLPVALACAALATALLRLLRV